jgi:hypothetical protein
MAISQHADGSQTATLDTEHPLGTDPDTTDGVFQFFVDVDLLVRGETLEIRIYEKCRAAGDTAKQIHMWKLAHDQTDPLWVSPPLVLLHGWRFTIKQSGGTGRVFPWSIRLVS